MSKVNRKYFYRAALPETVKSNDVAGPECQNKKVNAIAYRNEKHSK